MRNIFLMVDTSNANKSCWYAFGRSSVHETKDNGCVDNTAEVFHAEIFVK